MHYDLKHNFGLIIALIRYFIALFDTQTLTIFGLIVFKMLNVIFKYVNLVIYTLAFFAAGTTRLGFVCFSLLVVWFLSLIDSRSLKHTLSHTLCWVEDQMMSADSILWSQ